MHALIALISIWGNAPVCLTDGYTYECFYFDFPSCERAAAAWPTKRCVGRPDLDEENE